MAQNRQAEAAVRAAITESIIRGDSTARIMSQYLVTYELVHEIRQAMCCRRTRRRPGRKKKLSA